MINNAFANIKTFANEEPAVEFTAADEASLNAELEMLVDGAKEMTLLFDLENVVSTEGHSAASDLAYATLGFEADKENAFKRAWEAVKAFFARVWAKMKQFWNWLLGKDSPAKTVEKEHEEKVNAVAVIESTPEDKPVEIPVIVEATPKQLEQLKEDIPGVVINTLPKPQLKLGSDREGQIFRASVNKAPSKVFKYRLDAGASRAIISSLDSFEGFLKGFNDGLKKVELREDRISASLLDNIKAAQDVAEKVGFREHGNEAVASSNGGQKGLESVLTLTSSGKEGKVLKLTYALKDSRGKDIYEKEVEKLPDLGGRLTKNEAMVATLVATFESFKDKALKIYDKMPADNMSEEDNFAVGLIPALASMIKSLGDAHLKMVRAVSDLTVIKLD